MIWECKIMNDMRISNYERYENKELWMIWEYRIMKWECENYEWYEKVKLWMIWEYKIMNDMRMYNYEWYENV